MAPLRAKQESTLVAGPSKERPQKNYRDHPYSSRPPHGDAPPGVQKLKSALRQTKRFLAKDNVGADVRLKTERRLKALEADITRAEQSRRERQHATKYHKAKFFERQKVVRRIKQTKRSMATTKTIQEEEKLKSALAGLRVDLNYVLHFPKTKKYISLFPPDVRRPGFTTVPVTASLDNNEERSKVREMIRKQMERGDLSTEPENELEGLGQESRRLVSGRRGSDMASSIKSRTRADNIAKDDFFGDDIEEESQQSDVSDS